MRLVRANAPAARRGRAPRPSRSASAAVAILAAAALVAGCHAGSGSGSAATANFAITVAATPGVDNAPLYIAAKDGLFKKAGLDVTIRSYPSVGKELQALGNGTTDVAAGDYADFFYAAATSHQPVLRVVADGYHASPGVMEVLAGPDSGITTPQDLVGKTVGTSEPQLIKAHNGIPYSLDTVATQSVLQNDGVHPDQITWKPLPTGDLITALADHKVNAILVQEPYIYQAETQLGAIEVLDSCSGATAGLPLSGYFAVGSFTRQHAQALREFRSALEQAQAQAVLPGQVHEVLARYSGESMQSASLVTIGSYPTSLQAAALQRVADLMFSAGVLVQAFEVAPMVVG